MPRRLSMTRVLFVCLGNICRSPLGEGILRRLASERSVLIEVDSAGTGDYHIGELPDPRAQKVGREHGCDMSMRARQFCSLDFDDFDLIVVMDRANLRDVLRWQGAIQDKVHLASEYIPNAIREDVPDPYYGSLMDFEAVAAMLESACSGILDQIET